ncbi:MAG TPA: hypothetical protein VF389_04085, partial [Woeseiaceae bacterium]
LVPIARNLDFWWPSRKLALLHELFKMPDLATRLHPPAGRFRSQERRSIRAREVRAYFDRFLEPTELISGSPLDRWLNDGDAPEGEELDRFAKAAALRQWSEGVDFRALVSFGTRNFERKARDSDSVRRELAAFYYISLGQLGDTAEMVTAVLGALRHLFEQVNADCDPGTTAQRARELWTWEQTVRYGVPRGLLSLPLIVSFAKNERLRRRTIFALYKAIGSPADVRSWLGKAAPEGVRQRVWEAFQAGLLWWRDEARDWNVGSREPDMVRLALEELVSTQVHATVSDGRGLPRQLPTPATAHAPRSRGVAPHNGSMLSSDQASKPRAQVTASRIDRVLHTLEVEAADRIRACKGQYDRFLALLHSELTRAPLLAKVRAMSAQSKPLQPIWLVGLGLQITPVAAFLGDLEVNDLSSSRRGSAGTEPLLIVGGVVATNIAELPRNIRTIVTASALMALARWASQRPEDLKVLTNVFAWRGRIVRSATDALASERAEMNR